jgi:hypothetical protein
MSSILKVDSIQNSAGTVIMPVMAGGIIQTQVHQEDGLTYWPHASAAGADRLLLAADATDGTSHLSVTITPTSATSKILLTTTVFFEGSNSSNQNYLWTFYRDSTKLGQTANLGNRRGGIMSTSNNHVSADANSTPDSAAYSYYDSPNTTSAITYAVAFNFSSNTGNVFLNRTHANTDSTSFERGVSIIIAQEIAQ